MTGVVLQDIGQEMWPKHAGGDMKYDKLYTVYRTCMIIYENVFSLLGIFEGLVCKCPDVLMLPDPSNLNPH